MFFMKLTQYGVARMADALADGPPVELTHMAVGDGNGQPVGEPTGNETALSREVHRRTISAIYKNPIDSTVFMVEMTIPSDVGGWSMREIGVFDTNGQLFAYGNFPHTDKTIAAEGSTRDMVIVGAMKVATTAVVNLVIDAAVVLASRSWVLATVTGAYIIPGGLTNQILAKESNLPGHFKWIDITEGVQVLVNIVQETQSLAASQTIVNFSIVNTSGLAVYVEGSRLIAGVDYSVTGLAQITLATTFTAGSVLHAYQNDPLEAPEYLRPGLNLSDLPDTKEARANLGVTSKTNIYFMGQS